MLKIKESFRNLIRNGFFHVLFGATLSKVIFFISSIAIVRLISKDEYAFLAYADNIYSYVFLLSGLGCASAVLKYCVFDNEAKNKAYLVFAFKFGTAFQLLILAIVVVAFQYIPIAFPEAEKYILSLSVYPILYFWIGLLQSFMRARLRNKEFALSGLIQAVVVLLGSVALAVAVGTFGIITARYIGLAVIILYSYKIIRKDIKNIESEKLNKTEKSIFLKFALSMLVANLFSMIMPINESFLVNNIIKDATITAEYKVANLIPAQLSFITSSIVTYYFPIFAKMESKNEIWRQSKRVGMLTFLLIAIVVAIGIVISPYIIAIVYGSQYDGIGVLMTLMWIMYAINAGFRMLPMNILPAVGFVKFNLYMSIATSVVHFVVDAILIYMFGINGAVFAGGIVYFISGCFYWIYLKRNLRC